MGHGCHDCGCPNGCECDMEAIRLARLAWGCTCGHPEASHGMTGCLVTTPGHHLEYCECSGSRHDTEALRKIEALLRMPCLDHPRYQALRKPRASCEECWSIWLAVKPLREKLKTDRERKTMKEGL